MATRIYFSGVEKPIRVEEEPSQVQNALNSESGGPFRLTTDRGKDIWLNPAVVAYWYESGKPQVHGMH